MNSINWGSSDKKTFRAVNAVGMSFVMTIQHATANTAFAANPVDFSLLKPKLTFYKAKTKSTHEIFNDAMLPLMLESGFFDGGFQQNLQIGTFVAPVYIAAAMSVDEVLKLSGYIDFGGVINCEPGDELNFSVTVNPGALSAVADSAVSYFQYDIVEGVGLSDSIPVVKCQALTASISSDKFYAGDNVEAVSFINSDKAGITSAVQVITDMQFDSDKITISDSWDELRQKRDRMFEDLAQSSIRNQCFRLFDMKISNKSHMVTRLNDVKMAFTFTGSNVNATKNWYVVRARENNAAVAANYASKVGAQFRRNAAMANA